MIEVDAFTDDQKKFLSLIVDDLGGPTSTGSLLYIIESLLDGLKPDWRQSAFNDDLELKADLDVCMAALAYLKVQQVAAGT